MATRERTHGTMQQYGRGQETTAAAWDRETTGGGGSKTGTARQRQRLTRITGDCMTCEQTRTSRNHTSRQSSSGGYDTVEAEWRRSKRRMVDTVREKVMWCHGAAIRGNDREAPY
ncbi:uncharacterized protein LOC130967953 [Arachis stenosperma]|uniref:uncharacterized protein LOC130967953 n=1 Tax=Arachis stenosperma TaxID=217475 RepID=UPI0025ABF26E|nr:uncharacterized protein LOC130967953 [Arachis stenosperma]